MEHLMVARRINRRNGGSQRRQTLQLHRAIRDLSNPFLDPNFRVLYRLTPDLAIKVLEELKDFYPRAHKYSAIPVHIKFLGALHFFAQGNYQRPGGRDAIISLSQASISRVITQTTTVLNHSEVLGKWIRFPGILEKSQTVDKNYRKFKLPGVLGFIDGTHILIKKPQHNEHEELFVNRKGQHSLNVQVVCDKDLLILNILSKYPGSTHDAFIWKASAVRDKIKTLPSCWLLGDSGYPLEPWLLTPVLNAPENSQQAKYTHMHVVARNSIERLFGVWKNRFRCLNKHRVLEYAPSKAGCIINACAVLHNICIKHCDYQEYELDITEAVETQESQNTIEQDRDLLQRGQQVRDALICRL